MLFDEMHYKELLDGLEIEEMNLSVCKSIIDFRIDANTYKKEYVRTDKILKSLHAKSISSQMKLIQNFGAYSLCNDIHFVNSGVPFLMTQNIRYNYIDWTNIRYVDETSHKMLYKSHCSTNQVLVTMAGEYLGRVAVYDKDFVCSSNQAIAKITLNDNVSPYYVATFLNTKYGQNQINRFKTITGQPNINMSLIQSLLVPEMSQLFQTTIENYSKKINKFLQESKNSYDNAEDKLLEIFDFNSYIEPREKYSLKSFSDSFGTSSRLDAEYYQEKYNDLFDILNRYNTKPLYKLVDIYKSAEPGSDYYSSEGVPFIRVSDITKYGLSEPAVQLQSGTDSMFGMQYPKKDTILLTKDGSVGIAYKVQADADFVTSSALLHLTIKKDVEMLPDYLVLVLNSKIVQMQAERDVGGSIIQHWKPSEIENVVIPIVDMKLQEELAHAVQYSFELRTKANEMINNAIRTVEIAVECGEKNAIKHFEVNK